MYNITAVKGNLKLDLSSFFKDVTDAKQVANDIAITIPGVTYLSPIIAKGRDFIVKNNRIENILSLNPEVAAYGFYCSASNHLLAENNYIKSLGCLFALRLR